MSYTIQHTKIRRVSHMFFNDSRSKYPIPPQLQSIVLPIIAIIGNSDSIFKVSLDSCEVCFINGPQNGDRLISFGSRMRRRRKLSTIHAAKFHWVFPKCIFLECHRISLLQKPTQSSPRFPLTTTFKTLNLFEDQE